MKLKIIIVASARPNFMKIAPILHEINENYDNSVEYKLVHTGQHYDYKMSKIFFDELGIPIPDYHLGIGSGSHAVQTAKVMVEFEKVLDSEKPDWVIVVGDVNPTMACTIVSKKKNIKVAHVEAGLRSYDRQMPEELNRILTDCISDLLLTPSIDANMNLVDEGIAHDKIVFVGNIMIDTLFNMERKADTSDILERLSLAPGEYFLVTLHRPSNVDHVNTFQGLTDVLEYASKKYSIVWPIHPRAKKQAEKFGLMEKLQGIGSLQMIEPIGYTDNIKLMKNAVAVLTDSGGIQEETTALGVPCLTIRENTERPITITEGTNTLSGTNPEKIKKDLDEIIKQKSKRTNHKPLYWDGNTSKRVVEALLKNYG
jgi:UDP-N-acetylglucosamine 2-epimerase (non-hydrolysing)